MRILFSIAQSFVINQQVISLSSLPFYNLDHDPFRLTPFEFRNGGTINFDLDRLAQLEFNPLLRESYKYLSLGKDIDPDTYFHLENNSCEKYTEEQRRLNLNCSSLESGLSFLHLCLIWTKYWKKTTTRKNKLVFSMVIGI